MSDKSTIAILGGTGDLGTGLAVRWAKAGYPVIIGSRTQEKAEAAVASLKERQPDATVTPLENVEAAAAADIVAMTVPYEHHASTLATVKPALAGKIFIDCTVPLMPPKVGTVQLPAAGCAAVEAQELLGEDVQVVSAFQNIAAHLLNEIDREIGCDVLVAGNKVAAREKVIELIEAAGMRGFQVGPLANSAAAEALTSILIQINRKYDISHAGIRIIGQAD